MRREERYQSQASDDGEPCFAVVAKAEAEERQKNELAGNGLHEGDNFRIGLDPRDEAEVRETVFPAGKRRDGIERDGGTQRRPS